MQPIAELEYVGFWLRVWASIIDTALLMMVTLPLLMAIYGSEQLASGVVLYGPADFFISYVLPAVAIIAFWRTRQATPGKILIGARIVDQGTGLPPSMKQHIVRYLSYFLSAFFFCLGFFWIAFDRKKQGWHDKLAGTVVVRPQNVGAEAVRFGE